MADCMAFPPTIEEFIASYSFNDSHEVYTNGAELIPVFRVEQALEHYLKEVRNKAIDEFAEVIADYLDNRVNDLLDRPYTVTKELAEILKAGGKDE